MNFLNKRSYLAIVSITVLTILNACADDGKSRILKGKDKDGAPAGGDGSPAQTSGTGDGAGNGGGGDGTTGQPVDPNKSVIPNYRIGDEIVKIEESKSWIGNASEPRDWSARTQRTFEIIKIYEANSNCKYRFKLTDDNLIDKTNTVVNSEFDFDCKSSVAQCKTETSCTSTPIASEDIGPFKGATGEKKICITTTCGAEGRQRLTKIQSNIWKHKDGITPDNVVRQWDYTCSMSLALGDIPANFDACSVSPGHGVSRTKTNLEVIRQKEGNGGTSANAKVSSNSLFSTTNGPVSKETPIVRNAICTKTANNARLRVELTNTFCTGNGIAAETLILHNIPLTSPNQSITGANAVVRFSLKRDLNPPSVPMCPASYGRDFNVLADQGCSITLSTNASDKKIIGKGSCGSEFFWDTPAVKATNTTQGSPLIHHALNVSDFEFVCDAPENFDFTIFTTF